MHYQELYLENQVLARGQAWLGQACAKAAAQLAAWLAALLWSDRGGSRGLSLAYAVDVACSLVQLGQ